MTYFQLRDTAELLGFQSGQQGDQVGAGERPLKWFGRLLVSRLEGEQAIFEFAQGREVIRGYDLALYHREVDFDLVQPARMVRSVHQGQRRPLRAKARGSFFPAMRRAVVADPKHPARGPIGLGDHHLPDKSIDCCNCRCGFAPAK